MATLTNASCLSTTMSCPAAIARPTSHASSSVALGRKQFFSAPVTCTPHCLVNSKKVKHPAGLTLCAAVVEDNAPAKMSEIKMWNGKMRLQTQVLPIAQDTTAIRSLDWDRERFDIEFGLQEGTTYNSYIIRGDRIALVDSSHEKFRDMYMRTLKGEVDLKDINYIIVSHTEPDHSGLIGDIVAANPDVVVAGSKVALSFLENLIFTPFKQKVLKGGDTIDLGQGHVLEFVMAPNLHWPDTMFSLDRGTGIMYTCDAFGAHYCTTEVFDKSVGALEPHYRFYYDCLMKPNARSVLTALRKIKDWEYGTIATGHGPLLRYHLPELTGKYQSWSENLEKSPATIAVFYVSGYGYSDRLSQALARGITKTEACVEMYDLAGADPQELVECVGRANVLVIMSPPTQGNRGAAVGTVLAAATSKKKVLVCESYGGDDEPVDPLVQKFVNTGVESIGDPLRVKDTPCDQTYQQFEEYGLRLGQNLMGKASMLKKKDLDNDMIKALGRVSGGLYVITAGKAGARSAMIASWVSQASFKPLGLTVAVAKDRAIESFMQVGDSFVVNCLEEGNYLNLMKHFLKRFPPGADRFEGVNTRDASCGSPILEDSIAYMECTVQSRMETADHWITYAVVKDGAVTKKNAKTAAHHRKVGSYY